MRIYLLLALLFLTPSSRVEAFSAQPDATGKSPAASMVQSQVTQDDPRPPSNRVLLPVKFDRRVGDLDDMVQIGTIRALVVLDPIGFFYDRGLPKGLMYEALREFQRFTNHKLNTGTLKVQVTFVPVRVDQLEAALTEGMGDLIAYGVVITPERERRVAFSTPIRRDVTHIIVTGPDYGAVSTLEGLGGKVVYVNPLTVYDEELRKVNASLRASGKVPIVIKAADKNLSTDDLIQMVNAGAIPATVTTSLRAELWSRVLDNLTPHPELVIASGMPIAWVMRKNNPAFKELVDEFVSSHAVGTSFGNTLIERYLKDTHWVMSSTSKSEMEKLSPLVAIFQKFATEYDFDYLMLAAQGYQESRLNQAALSPGGAVGIMQVRPEDAAASPINITDVTVLTNNIHAGAKMLRSIADTYFKDPNVDPFNRALFTLAGYNAGPTLISGLREQARGQGLDPNIWFENVELLAARQIGQITIMYVRNIYKYYVA
jgi:membrane-bound lytic murein transglycosylase MltF